MKASGTRRFLTAIVAVVAIGVLCAGCGRDDDDTLDTKLRADLLQQAGEARQHGFDELARALHDGRYTDTENARLFSLYEECLTKAGFDLGEHYQSPIDGRTLELTIRNEDELTAEDGDEQYQCLHRYLAQGPVFGEDPGPMAEPLRRFVLECLERRGERVDPTDRTMRDAMTTAGGHTAQAVVGDCIDKGMRSEYPDMGFGYGMPSIF